MKSIELRYTEPHPQVAQRSAKSLLDRLGNDDNPRSPDTTPGLIALLLRSRLGLGWGLL